MHICHRWCTEPTVAPLDFVLGDEERAQETASADVRQRPGKDYYGRSSSRHGAIAYCVSDKCGRSALAGIHFSGEAPHSSITGLSVQMMRVRVMM